MADVHYWITGKECLHVDVVVPVFDIWKGYVTTRLIARRYILDVGDGYLLMDAVAGCAEQNKRLTNS